MKIDSLTPIYLSVIVWHVGGSLIMPFVSIWLRSEIGEESFFYLALFITLPNIISIFGMSLIGKLTDKYGKYRVIIFLINVVGVIEYSLLTQISHAYEYLVIIGTGALVFPSYYTIVSAYATNICAPDEKGKVTSYLMLNASLGWFVGSLFSGKGYINFGMNAMLLIAALMFLISGSVVFLGPEFSKKTTRIENKEILITRQSSYSELIKNKTILYILLSVVIIDFSAGMFFSLGVIYLKEIVRMSPELIGYSNAMATILAVFVLKELGPLSDKIGRKKIFLLGLALYPSLFTALSLSRNLWVNFVLWGIPVYAVLRPTLSAMISDITNPVDRSKGMTLLTISSTLAMALGAIILGIITDITGNIFLWVQVPAILGWISIIIGYLKVDETLKNSFKNRTQKINETVISNPQ